MGIVGSRPETGIRIEVERDREGGPPWRYAGHVVTPGERFAVVATVAEDGTVSVELPAEAPATLGPRARLLLRTAWTHAKDDGVPPPRRIVRWRADR